MNIFYLDDNPITAATFQCDKHVVKMILESCQILSFAHHFYKTEEAVNLYRPTHKHHQVLIKYLQQYPKMDNDLLLPPPQCMPDYCKDENPVIAYRNYYIFEKSIKMQCNWTKRNRPWWFN
jgi:hypothetical protein